MISEKQIIEQCSLTLSSLKTASLFTVRFNRLEEVEDCIDFWNEKFISCGIKVKMLKTIRNTALIYFYREDMLKYDLDNRFSKRILKRFGYKRLDVDGALEKLSERLSEYEEFPHEIGLFLGYPPKDVEGFICNGGKNCSACRYWKVYGDKSEALQMFSRFDKCNAIYKKLWQQGRDILQLTVKKQLVA